MNWIVAALSRLLEPTDRECVCGDLEELQLSAPAAAANIFGLVIRRQLAAWCHWGPWVAMFAVSGFAGSFLCRSMAHVGLSLFVQIRTYVTYGVAYEPGGVTVPQQISYLATSIMAVLLWSWACGFVLASLSGRALWITVLLFYCVVLDDFAVRMVLAGNIILKHSFWEAMLRRLLPLDPVIVVFLLALALGVRSARKRRLKPSTRLLLPAGGLTLVILLAWMENWFPAGFARWSGQAYVPTPFLYRMLPLLAGAWPVFLIPLLVRPPSHGPIGKDG